MAVWQWIIWMIVVIHGLIMNPDSASHGRVITNDESNSNIRLQLFIYLFIHEQKFLDLYIARLQINGVNFVKKINWR